MGEKDRFEENWEYRTSEALLGDDDAFESDETVEEFISALGIDRSTLSNNFAEFLEKRAQESKESEESGALNSAAQQIRRQDESDRKPKTINTQRGNKMSGRYWTNPSVLLLAKDGDPVQIITAKARQMVLDFSEADNDIKKIDPFLLAEFCGISVAACGGDVKDSRTVFRNDKFVIEFDPTRPRPRIRYSICHEIIHTLFPDCGEQIRYRATHEDMKGDDWQLEMLCNVGASELLMPLGSLPEFDENNLSIEELMKLRKELEVSTEALFLRVAQVAQLPFAVFSASLKNSGQSYQIDYVRPSKLWCVKIPNGWSLPEDSVVKNCTAIGFTNFGQETWLPELGQFHVECVGIAPHPNQTLPRVMGIIRPLGEYQAAAPNQIKYVRGDATKPHETGGERVLAHVVNDKTPNWGGPFAFAVRKKWSLAQESFREWAGESRNLTIGNVHFVKVDQHIDVATIVAQKGYGPSKKPRIRYKSLKECLDKIADFAAERNASVHMPRIGSGQAGGNWEIIAELIEDALCARGIVVYVYTLPGAEVKKEPQGRLFS